MATIDELSIKIESDSTSATQSIDNLVKSLKGLQSATQAASGLDSISNSLTRLMTAVSGQNQAQFANFTTQMKNLGAGLSNLSAVDKSVATTINALSRLGKVGKTLDQFDFTSFTAQMQQLASALTPLSQVGKISLGSTLNQLKKLPDTIEALKGADLQTFAEQMKQVSAAIAPLADQTVKLNTTIGALPKVIKSANASMNTFKGTTSKSTKTTSDFNQKLNKMYRTVSMYAAVLGVATRAIADFFDESSSYVENLNLFTVAMGDATDSALEFANTVSQAMGIDPSEWMKYQGSFNMLARGFGVSSKNAQIMSQNLTQLAYDYSSLFNTSVEAAFDKLNSAMSGQIKGLKEFGNNVSVAAVKETGLKYGLDGAVSSWDQNTQAMMRYVTIMNNAAKVDVFNDMARTIATPANAVRILSAQFTLLKRSIGNVCSVFISKAIPYVMMFVQVVQKALNWLASLFGFSIPQIDYSGISAGASDVEDASDALDDVGDSAGGANKKAKELKKTLMGFDELNIIPAPDDDSGGGGGGGAGGGGGSIGDIELPQYNFLDGLANAADERLNALMDKLAYMFEPLSNSWDKYGQSVFHSLEYEIDAIKGMMESIGDSFYEVWHNGTGEESLDYIFQTTSNINVAVGNLANNFREAWDECGRGTQVIQNVWDGVNNLFRSVTDISEQLKIFTNNLDLTPLMKSLVNLSDAFEKFADVVGKNVYDTYKQVLEPLAKWIIESAVPRSVEALSSTLKGLSKIMESLRPAQKIVSRLYTELFKLCANAIITGINAVAKALDLIGTVCKPLTPLISGLATPVLTFISAWKITQLATVSKTVKTLTNGLTYLKVAIEIVKTDGLMAGFTALASCFNGAEKSLTGLTGVLSKANAAMASTTAWQTLSRGIETLATKCLVASESGGVLGTVMSGLGSVLAFVSANPVTAIVAGVAALGAAYAICTTQTQKATDSYASQNERMKELTETAKGLASAQQEANKNAISSAESTSSSYLLAQDYVQKLIDLTGEDGYCKNLNLARMYADKINEVCGETVTITDDGTVSWNENTDAVKRNIEQLKYRAMIQAYEEAYIQAINSEVSVTNALNEAKATQNSQQTEFNNLIMEGMANGLSYDAAYQQAVSTHTDLFNAITNSNTAVSEATTAYVANQEAIKQMEAAQNSYAYATDTSAEGIAKYGQALVDLQLEYSNTVGAGGELSYKWADLRAQMVDLDNKVKESTGIEKQQNQAALDYVKDCVVKKAVYQGDSYKKMTKQLGDAYKNMTAEEKKQLEQQYNNLVEHDSSVGAERLRQNNELLALLKKYNIDTNSEEAKRYKEALASAQKNGTDVGAKYIEKVASEMADGQGKTSKSIKSTVDKTNKYITDNPAKMTVNTTAAEKSISKLRDNATRSMSASLGINIYSTKRGLRIGTGKGAKYFSISLYANGGLPDIGEMFVARENGPELVGRLGAKNAVANNAQIVESVSQGVYRAMVASAQNGGADVNITISNQIDGREVGKSFVQYHNGVVKQTGKSPLKI